MKKKLIIIFPAILGLSSAAWLFYWDWKIALGVICGSVARHLNVRLRTNEYIDAKQEVQKNKSKT